MNEKCFCETGNADEETMASAKKGVNGRVNGLFLPDDDLPDLGLKSREPRGELIQYGSRVNWRGNRGWRFKNRRGGWEGRRNGRVVHRHYAGKSSQEFQNKEAEDGSTPRRCRAVVKRCSFRKVVECGCPLPVCTEAC